MSPLKRAKSFAQRGIFVIVKGITHPLENNTTSMNINKVFSPFAIEGMMTEWNFTWGPPTTTLALPPTTEQIVRYKI